MEDQLDILTDDNLWAILEDNPDNIKSNTKLKTDIYNQSCLECESTNIIYTTNRGSFICNECGCESREILDDSPEWTNNYDDKKTENNRCIGPSNAFYPRSSLGTTINIPGYSKIKMLRTWDHIPYRERSLAKVLNEMDSNCKKFNIPKAVIDYAKILYRNIRETKHESGINKGKNVIIRGINRKQIIAACFYFGSVLQKIPRSTKEVADIFNLQIKQITKGCRKFLEIMKDNFIVFDIKPSYGSNFVDRFGSKIKLSKEVIQLSKTISDNTTKLDIASDHQATSIAAASILLATIILKEDVSKKTISDIFNISDVTITKTFKKISPYEKIIIDDDLTNQFNFKINLKLMSTELESEENITDSIVDSESDSDSDIESITDTEGMTETESETDILIKKLNQTIEEIPVVVEDIVDDFLDESDVIKKDNKQSKKNKYLLAQEEKNIRKLNKLKLKETKAKLKLEIKESKKLLNKQSENRPIEVLDNLTKKKRGRPKKILTN